MIRVFHQTVREALSELSDRAYQERVWMASEGPEVGSLTEAISGLYDDSGLGRALDRGQEVYGPQIDNLLVELRRLLKRVDDRRAPMAILQDPQMNRVRNLASDILRRLTDGQFEPTGGPDS